MKPLNKISLIAPCGMNCGICMAYLRDKNHCPGCRGSDINKAASCLNCRIKNCEFIKIQKAKYCFECKNIPCDKLKHLDKRYRTKYNMSMLENLENIKKNGIRKFVQKEEIRWACPDCGGTINVHRKLCSACGKSK
jgi:hypothetical protein